MPEVALIENSKNMKFLFTLINLLKRIVENFDQTSSQNTLLIKYSYVSRKSVDDAEVRISVS